MKNKKLAFILLTVGIFIVTGQLLRVNFPFLLEETEITTGKATGVKPILTGKGFYTQIVTYRYEVNDKTYHDNVEVGKQYGVLHVGDEVEVRYAVDDPGKHEVIDFVSKTDSLGPELIK